MTIHESFADQSLAEACWQADQDLAQACLHHPFVQGLGDGTLSRSRFIGYIAQDAFFLRGFAQAYAAAQAKCQAQGDDAGAQLYADLGQGVADELRLHRQQSADLGIDLDGVQPQPATSAYTSFLQSTAAQQPEPIIAAAMLPCLRLYAWLGQSLLPGHHPHGPTAAWVTTYADPAFEALWRRLAPRLQPGARSPDLRAAIAAHHRQAMVCELDFFAGAWAAANS
ncbi:MAG: TenA family protein [Planctomycetota bacterium]|nr:MAG: TenA family protein [Planctomycetota bacterium]